MGGTKRSLLSSGAYSLGSAFQRAIGLILLPVYTAVLSPAEYGVLGLLTATYVGVGILFSLALDTIIVRNYFQLATQPEERQRFIDSIWRFLIFGPVTASLVLTAVAWPFVGDAKYVDPIDIGLTFVSAAVNVAATIVPQAVLRSRQDLRGYLWMTGVLAIGTTGLTLLFVVGLDLGVRGWFLAMFLGNLALFVTSLFVVPWRRAGRLDWKIVGAAVLFSLPLIPHVASHWALQLADRGVIATMVSSTELGIYTLAANLASVLMMLVMSLNQGFAPIYARAGAEEGLERQVRQTAALQIAIVVAMTLAVALLGPPMIEILATSDYHEAASLVPWLAIGYGFLGVYFVPMNGATLGAGRRGLAWVATAVSAAANILLLLALVPKYGIEAAAVSSALGYLVLLVLLATWAHSGENPVTYDWARIVPTVAIAAVVYALSTVPSPDGPVLALIVQTAFLLLFVVGVGGLMFRAQITARLGSAGRA